MLIFKIVPRALWAEAEVSGTFGGAPVDLADGYIHFSSAVQVRDTARLHFAGQDDLLLVALDADTLGPGLRWESSRRGALFPHLYCTFATADVAWIADLPLGSDGLHRFPAALS